MCGIFGFIKKDGILSESEIRQAIASTQSLTHRGPDACGHWLNCGVFVGHKRLKILDLSEGAAQPFKSPDGRYILAYNGEIYNYIELRKELEAAGSVFRTSSDTEVFLEAFVQWGTESFSRFDGMFAASIFDTVENVHILVRDSFGQKPLYYSLMDGVFAYGSELRSLLLLGNRRVDRSAFLRFLINSYYAWDTTPVENVHKLLPGCWLQYKAGEIATHRYFWSFPGKETLDISPNEAVDRFEALFETSCKQSLRSDVPYGVFLSGGIDSTLVAAACKEQDPNLYAFSVGMDAADFDESQKARAAASHIGISNLHVRMLGTTSIKDCFESFLATADEPHGDPGFVNALFISKACREDITVALTGDGGDEVFAGYLPFKGLPAEPLLHSIPAPLVRFMKFAIEQAVPSSDSYLGFKFKAQAYLRGFPGNRNARFPLWLATQSLEELRRLAPWASDSFLVSSCAPDTIFDYSGFAAEGMEDASMQQRLLQFYQRVFLPEFVCHHTDRASMRHSLEVRSPFLSVPLVQFANSLPDEIRTKRGSLKWVLKEALKRKGLPPAICQQEKRGFTFPVARWMKRSLRDIVESAIQSPAVEESVDIEQVRRLWRSHLNGSGNHYRILLNLVAYSAWREQYPMVSW